MRNRVEFLFEKLGPIFDLSVRYSKFFEQSCICSQYRFAYRAHDLLKFYTAKKRKDIYKCTLSKDNLRLT